MANINRVVLVGKIECLVEDGLDATPLFGVHPAMSYLSKVEATTMAARCRNEAFRTRPTGARENVRRRLDPGAATSCRVASGPAHPPGLRGFTPTSPGFQHLQSCMIGWPASMAVYFSCNILNR
jgi:hypothetical protein